MDYTHSRTNSQTPPVSEPAQLGNYSSLQIVVLVLNSAFLASTIVAVGLRFWSRRIKRMTLVVNDWVAAISLIFLLGYFALITYGICTGMGRRVENLASPQKQILHLLKLMVPLPILWSTINTLVKISIIDLYLRVFPSKRLRLLSYSLLSLACSYWVISILFAFLNCRPFSYTWDKSKGTQGGHCVDPQGGTLGFGIVNLVLDVAVIILPLPYLFILQLKLSKRISLVMIFALGFVITAISALRIKTIISSPEKSFTRGSAEIALWSFLETSLSIINCCLPTIQPALLAMRHAVTRKITSSQSSHTSTIRHKFVSLTSGSTNHTSAPQSRAMSPLEGQHAGELKEFFVSASERKPSAKEIIEHRPDLQSPISAGRDTALNAKDLPPLPPSSQHISAQRGWSGERAFYGSDRMV